MICTKKLLYSDLRLIDPVFGGLLEESFPTLPELLSKGESNHHWLFWKKIQKKKPTTFGKYEFSKAFSPV